MKHRQCSRKICHSSCIYCNSVCPGESKLRELFLSHIVSSPLWVRALVGTNIRHFLLLLFLLFCLFFCCCFFFFFFFFFFFVVVFFFCCCCCFFFVVVVFLFVFLFFVVVFFGLFFFCLFCFFLLLLLLRVRRGGFSCEYPVFIPPNHLALFEIREMILKGRKPKSCLKSFI